MVSVRIFWKMFPIFFVLVLGWTSVGLTQSIGKPTALRYRFLQCDEPRSGDLPSRCDVLEDGSLEEFKIRRPRFDIYADGDLQVALERFRRSRLRTDPDTGEVYVWLRDQDETQDGEWKPPPPIPSLRINDGHLKVYGDFSPDGQRIEVGYFGAPGMDGRDEVLNGHRITFRSPHWFAEFEGYKSKAKPNFHPNPHHRNHGHDHYQRIDLHGQGPPWRDDGPGKTYEQRVNVGIDLHFETDQAMGYAANNWISLPALSYEGAVRGEPDAQGRKRYKFFQEVRWAPFAWNRIEWMGPHDHSKLEGHADGWMTTLSYQCEYALTEDWAIGLKTHGQLDTFERSRREILETENGKVPRWRACLEPNFRVHLGKGFNFRARYQHTWRDRHGDDPYPDEHSRVWLELYWGITMMRE